MMPDDDENLISLTDGEGNEVEFYEIGRMKLNGKEYIFLEEPEDEGSVLVYYAEEDEDGEEVLSPVEDEDECENAFYYFQAEADDYEVGPAE